MRRDQLNRRVHRTSLAAKAERPSSPQIIQRGRAVRVGGGGSTCLAYCKAAFSETEGDEMSCYLGVDLAAWSAAATYAANDWVEVAGTEYKSLQDDNTDHAVTDTDWWEEGTVSVTVRFLIANGSSLMYAAPNLPKGQEIRVTKIGGVWVCDHLFNGARFT